MQPGMDMDKRGSMSRNWALGITGVGERVFLYQLGLLGTKMEGEGSENERTRERDHQHVLCAL